MELSLCGNDIICVVPMVSEEQVFNNPSVSLPICPTLWFKQDLCSPSVILFNYSVLVLTKICKYWTFLMPFRVTGFTCSFRGAYV